MIECLSNIGTSRLLLPETESLSCMRAALTGAVPGDDCDGNRLWFNPAGDRDDCASMLILIPSSGEDKRLDAEPDVQCTLIGLLNRFHAVAYTL